MRTFKRFLAEESFNLHQAQKRLGGRKELLAALVKQYGEKKAVSIMNKDSQIGRMLAKGKAA